MSISATRKFMSSCNSSFESSRHADFKNISLHSRLRSRIKNLFLTQVYFFGGKFTFFACLDATLNQVNTNKFLLRKKKAGVLEKYLQSIMNGQSRTILIGVESLDQKKYRKLPNNQGSTSFVQYQLFFPLSHFKCSDSD